MSVPSVATVAPPASAAASCLHCGLRVSGRSDGYCCAGCRTVHRLLQREGLERYYDLRGTEGAPVPELRSETRDEKWLDSFEEELTRGATENASLSRISLDVQGIHCTACVWLMRELFDRKGGGIQAEINPTLGRMNLVVEPSFPLRQYVREVERFGYLLGPPLKEHARKSDELLLRMAITIALAINSMVLSAAMYFGLSSGRLYTWVQQLNFALAVAALIVGGSVFLRSAWLGIRARVLHLDIPIAVGIVLAFAGSTWSFFFEQGRAVYLDSLSIFIALMLVGRWLQERVVERNRRAVLAHDGVEALLTRRLKDGKTSLVASREIALGDRLLIVSGDLIPVESEVVDLPASCSLDWINGESRPRVFQPGDTLPAGAFNVGSGAIEVIARQSFEQSALPDLLRVHRPRDEAKAGRDPWWARVSAAYVVAVLLVAMSAFLYWWLGTSDLIRALEVTTAVLVVTCPCAFGIATPLAYELVQARLRRAGLFIRSSDFLERALGVRRVVFDKTGTLTAADLALEDEAPLDRLENEDRQALYDLCARSAHPKSRALARALADRGATLRTAIDVHEEAGRGVQAEIDGRRVRLGEPRWALGASSEPSEGADADVAFVVDGQLQSVFSFVEQLRPDASTEIDRLIRMGYEPWILSGDEPERVQAMAARLRIPPERAIGGATPVQKLRWIQEHDRSDSLMVGDGINDGLAVEAAWCAGTPAVDRPFMPAKTDFYFISPGLGPITQVLHAATQLAQTIHRNLAFAVAYNVIAVAIAWVGWMQPWLAAVLMPTSSLLILAATTATLSRRSVQWTY